MGRPEAIESLTETGNWLGVFCDIDDTLTWHGRIVPQAFLALEAAQQAGLRVVPITGRPGGWVDHLARTWPVDGVVGENGGLWFYMHQARMQRRFAQDAETRATNRARLQALGERILAAIPGTALASDQSYRDLDLAIDFCEDVPRLPPDVVDEIVRMFEAAGATAKVSSIHVNGWFGEFDKFEGCRRFVEERWGEDLTTQLDRYIYVGDSPNDEPMFARFPSSIGVANVREFLPRLKDKPRYITRGNGGFGFAEAIERILRA